MQLILQRFADNGNASLGILRVNDQFQCFTLEDEQRTAKVPSETRIPAGKYVILLRQAGRIHEQYAKHPKLKRLHHGMLHLQDVPGFSYIYIHIYIHIGNLEADTAGCILVGQAAKIGSGGTFSLAQSTAAYIDLYGRVTKSLQAGDSVTIEIRDE